MTAIPGCFFLALIASRLALWPTLRQLFSLDVGPVPALLVLVSISWFLAMSFRGAIGMLGFYADVQIGNVAFITGLFGLIGWALAARELAKEINKPLIREFFKTLNFEPRRWELVLFLVLLFQVSLYAYTSIVPWLGWDEMAIYGSFAKYVGNGWVAGDFVSRELYFSGDKFAEIVAAQEFYAVSDTYLARGLRVLNLVFCAVGFFGILRWMGTTSQWSLIIISGFLAVPDLVWLATSLKVDIVTTVLEASAFLLLGIGLVSMLPQHRNKIDSRTNLFMLAVVFAAMGFASRFSGIYFLAFVGVTASIFILWESGNWPVKSLKFLVIIGLGALGGIGYLFNMVELGNPLYFFQGPWPFEHGEYVTTMKTWGAKANITGIPPVAEQFYLLFHLALGVEAWTWKLGITSLPHAKAHAATMLWLSPAMLSILLVPFFIKRSGTVVVLGLVFIYWFTAWSLGFHYSRVFMAGSFVPVLIAGVIVSMDVGTLTKTQRYMRSFLAGGLILILLGFVPLQVFTVIDDNPFVNPFGGARERYESNIEVLRNHVNFRDFQGPYPSYQEAKSISKILSDFPKALVQMDRHGGQTYQILFDNGHFIGSSVDDPNQLPIHDMADCILETKDSNLSKQQRTIAQQTFTEVTFVTSTGHWKLRCRVKE